MMPDTDLYEAYYRQELGPAEAAAFEERLKTDAPFAAGYREFTLLAAGIQYYNRLRLVQAFKQADAAEAPDPQLAFKRPESAHKTIPLYRRSWLLAAAVVLLLALAGALFLLADRSSGGEQLYADYYTPLSAIALASPRGDADALYTLKEQAAEAYQQGENAASLQLLEEASPQAAGDGELLFLQGLNLLALERYAEAAQTLEQAGQYRFRNQQDARWYLALAYLAQENTAQARPLLQELAQTEGPYQALASEALSRLKQD